MPNAWSHSLTKARLQVRREDIRAAIKANILTRGLMSPGELASAISEYSYAQIYDQLCKLVNAGELERVRGFYFLRGKKRFIKQEKTQ